MKGLLLSWGHFQKSSRIDLTNNSTVVNHISIILHCYIPVQRIDKKGNSVLLWIIPNSSRLEALVDILKMGGNRQWQLNRLRL